ncbi:hypothetical protein M3J09_010577 [Ascochyta lentis]
MWFSNPGGGVAVEAGRPSRGQQSRAFKPAKPLARRPPRPQQHADTDEAWGAGEGARVPRCINAAVHLQPAGDRSFASAPLTAAPSARSCTTSLQRLSSPPFASAERGFPLAWPPAHCGALS